MTHEILIVDDEEAIRQAITGILEDEGYESRVAASSGEALDALAQRRPELLVLDVWLSGDEMDGLELLQLVRREQPLLPVVMISGHGTVELAVEAIRHGAYDFIEKPFKADRLLLVVERALEAAQLKRENQELRLRAGQGDVLLGRSSVMQQLDQAIGKVAPTGSRVLITGPPGSGKEVVARTLHAGSRRAEGPFVALNCATMHPDRLERELFGVEPGSDETDSSGIVGTLERAHGGTLLLDEVADMPRETQGKIVRVLQEQTFHRIGGSRRISVDVRVIAATNRDLHALMGEGRFREDLYYRLNVVPLRVPALKERREDIPDLIEHFVERSAETTGLTPRSLSDEAMALLQAYDWPGNVRQLRNLVDWILIMAPGDTDEAVGVDMLPPDIGAVSPGLIDEAGNTEVLSLPLREAREIFERRYLEAQVLRFGGNISKTATFIGMERSALHRKLRALGMTGERQTM